MINTIDFTSVKESGQNLRVVIPDEHRVGAIIRAMVTTGADRLQSSLILTAR